MPVYNSEAFLNESINSVISQSYTNFELIIIDDNSTDSSISIIKSFINADSRIHFIPNPNNLGVAATRKIGVDYSSGSFICFIDSDDFWVINKLEAQLNFMLINNINFSFTAYSKINHIKEIISDVGIPNILRYEDLLKTNFIGCSTAMISSTLLKSHYVNLVSKREDFELWLAILRSGATAHGLNDSLVYYSSHSNQSSYNKFSMIFHTWKVYSVQPNLNFFSSVYYFLIYILFGFFRYKLPRLAYLLGLFYYPKK